MKTTETAPETGAQAIEATRPPVHTQSNLFVGGGRELGLFDSDERRLVADLAQSHDSYSRMPLVECQANAARLVRAWNNLDSMEKAFADILSECPGGEIQDLDEANNALARIYAHARPFAP